MLLSLLSPVDLRFLVEPGLAPRAGRSRTRQTAPGRTGPNSCLRNPFLPKAPSDGRKSHYFDRSRAAVAAVHAPTSERGAWYVAPRARNRAKRSRLVGRLNSPTQCDGNS